MIVLSKLLRFMNYEMMVVAAHVDVLIAVVAIDVVVFLDHIQGTLKVLDAMQNSQKNLIISIILFLSSTTSILGMNRDYNEDSPLENFFKCWQNHEYHAKKFVDQTKYSGNNLIHYYNEDIKIATFDNQEKKVITYLHDGSMYITSYKEFKKLMATKLPEEKPKLYDHLLSIFYSLIK